MVKKVPTSEKGKKMFTDLGHFEDKLPQDSYFLEVFQIHIAKITKSITLYLVIAKTDAATTLDGVRYNSKKWLLRVPLNQISGRSDIFKVNTIIKIQCHFLFCIHYFLRYLKVIIKNINSGLITS